MQYLQGAGTIDLDSVKKDMKKHKIDEVLEKYHPYRIYQSKDGRWHTQVADSSYKEGRRRIRKQNLDELKEELYKHYTGEEYVTLEGITLEKLYPKWLKYKSLHTTSPGYISRIESSWKKYYKGTEIVNVPIELLTKLQLDEWIHGLIKKFDVSKNEFYNFAIIMRQALDYAIDLEIIDDNQFNKVKIDKRMFRVVEDPDDETQVYSVDELRSIQALATKDLNSSRMVYKLAPLAILFQFQTGLRVGELVALRYEDVSGDYIKVRRMYRRDSKDVVNYTKGKSTGRKVILTTEAKRIITIAKEMQISLGVDSTGYIFSLKEYPDSYRAVTDLYRKYCKKMGIVYKSSHKARKTYISALIDGQVNINTVRKMVGHSDEKTTLGNYCFDRSTAPEKVRLVENALRI